MGKQTADSGQLFRGSFSVVLVVPKLVKFALPHGLTTNRSQPQHCALQMVVNHNVAPVYIHMTPIRSGCCVHCLTVSTQHLHIFITELSHTQPLPTVHTLTCPVL